MLNESNYQKTSTLIFTLLLLIVNMQTTSALTLYVLNILLVGVLSFILFLKYRCFDLGILLLAMLFSICLIIVTCIQLPRYEMYTGLNTIIISKTSLSIYWIMCVVLIAKAISYLKTEQFIIALSVVIVLMSAFLFLQTISYYIFNYSLDFSTLTGGEGARSYYGLLYRPSGFLPEPSVYSGHMTALLALYLYYRKKIDYIFYIGFISVVLSFSTAGILLSILLYLMFSLIHKKSVFFYITSFLLVFIFIFFVLPLLMERFDLFLSGGDSSNNIKIDAIKNYFSDDNIFSFGYGMVGRDNPSLPSYYEALKDVTIFGAFFSIFGTFLGSILIFITSVFWTRSNLDLRYKIILLIPLLKLCSPSYAFFYIYILIYFLNLKRSFKT